VIESAAEGSSEEYAHGGESCFRNRSFRYREQLGFEKMPARGQPGMAFISDVRIRTYLTGYRTLALENSGQVQQNKTLRAAFQLQMGMSVVQHAS